MLFMDFISELAHFSLQLKRKENLIKAKSLFSRTFLQKFFKIKLHLKVMMYVKNKKMLVLRLVKKVSAITSKEI